MSAVLSSLFGGTTPPNATSYTQNLSQVPTWLLNSTNAMVGQANSVAGQPYQAYQGPQVAPWTYDQNAAQQITEGLQGQYMPLLNSATNLANAAPQSSSFASANGYIPQAAQAIQNGMTPGAAQMNPYTQNVINANNLNTQQFWQNSMQPQINSQFTANGNYGSAANQRAQNLSANQLTQNLNAQNLAALSGAYSNAQQAGLAGGQALGNLSQLQGGLGYEQGMLGLQGSQQLGNLASLGQNLGLQGAGTLYNVGQAQQQQGQQNLNTAYQNFENQTYYPQNQLNWLSGILRGAPTSTGSASTGTNSAPLSGATYGASPFNTAVGIYQGLGGGTG
jgi:hypothetical protein